MLVLLKNTIKEFSKTKTKNLLSDQKIITQQLKTVEKQNIIGIKSVTIEHPIASRKLSKTIKQAKKVSQAGGFGKKSSSPLYIETIKTFLKIQRL